MPRVGQTDCKFELHSVRVASPPHNTDKGSLWASVPIAMGIADPLTQFRMSAGKFKIILGRSCNDHPLWRGTVKTVYK